MKVLYKFEYFLFNTGIKKFIPRYREKYFDVPNAGEIFQSYVTSFIFYCVGQQD